ncbi:hypothetical protein [Aporhodopirellula aestuarii]|uniref:Transmembrane protein n=1 Tax=Aporhodopirellula aestuarii TaxID=2950107 RepID=A0ABT0UE49_9BACT|nr:hypothetical protein [Aporhodopirellula aestuarii]MCM2375009.1 hypothetical protein [Aporhodopirellula aestuarii]
MRITLASFLAAIVLFLSGFLWWGFLMPIAMPAKVLQDDALAEQIITSLTEPGLYIYPDYTSQEHAATSMLFYNSEPPPMLAIMGAGFLHMFASALFISLVVSRLEIASTSGRIAMVSSFGCFVAWWANVGHLIWWRHPYSWTAFHVAYDISSWVLAGIVIALIVKPATAISDVATEHAS